MPHILEAPLPPPQLQSPPLDTMSQTMLLTKRLTAFLSQNTTPQLPTLLLLSPTGKLLSSSSPSPASTLRTQATLACSLWNLYQPTTSIIPSALPSSQNHTQTQSQSQSQNQGESSQSRGGSDATFSSSTSTIADQEHDLSTITIQLSHGIMIIRALSCGLLFVAIGPASPSTSSSSSHPTNPINHHHHHPNSPLQAQAQINLSRHTSPPTSPQGDAHEGGRSGGGGVGGGGSGAGHLSAGFGSAAPSDAGSIRSTGTETRTGMGSLLRVKRQAVEIGKWLDGQLEGFRLSSPSDGR